MMNHTISLMNVIWMIIGFFLPIGFDPSPCNCITWKPIPGLNNGNDELECSAPLADGPAIVGWFSPEEWWFSSSQNVDSHPGVDREMSKNLTKQNIFEYPIFYLLQDNYTIFYLQVANSYWVVRDPAQLSGAKHLQTDPQMLLYCSRNYAVLLLT